MKNSNTDSTANLSRFARDKRQRTTTAERVERSPRPRREADNEGFSNQRAKSTPSSERRSSFNPHFTSDNRLRPEYERGNREERGISMEISTAAANLTGGADAVIMRHPAAVATIKKFITELV